MNMRTGGHNPNPHVDTYNPELSFNIEYAASHRLCCHEASLFGVCIAGVEGHAGEECSEVSDARGWGGAAAAGVPGGGSER
jgi:hypothetical protein